MSQYETFEAWLDKYLIKGLSPDVQAVNFNLYESSESDEDFDVQLIGAAEYDHDDPDWACNAIFSTEEDLCRIKATDWEECLQIIISYVQKYLSNGKYVESIANLQAITVGFVDGDLEIVFEK